MKSKPNLSLIQGTGGREQLVNQLLRELLLRDDSDHELIGRLKREIDRAQPALQVVKK